MRRAALCLVLVCWVVAAHAQGGRVVRGSSRAMDLVEEILVLQRLVPLQLTDAQIAQILQELGKQQPPSETPSESLQQLQEIKQRLLEGTATVAADQNAIRELTRQIWRQQRDGAPPAPPAADRALPTSLTPLEQAIWNLLQPVQKAALLGDIRGPAANNQRADQVLAAKAIKMIGDLRALDETQWPATRDRLAAALSTEAGAADSPQRQNCQRMFTDFLNRIKAMAQTDFATRQAELSSELLALLPPNSNLTIAMAEFNVRLIKDAMSGSLLHWRAADLLKQMQQARAAAAAK